MKDLLILGKTEKMPFTEELRRIEGRIRLENDSEAKSGVVIRLQKSRLSSGHLLLTGGIGGKIAETVGEPVTTDESDGKKEKSCPRN
jgi:hypothetical protein